MSGVGLTSVVVDSPIVDTCQVSTLGLVRYSRAVDHTGTGSVLKVAAHAGSAFWDTGGGLERAKDTLRGVTSVAFRTPVVVKCPGSVLADIASAKVFLSIHDLNSFVVTGVNSNIATDIK